MEVGSDSAHSKAVKTLSSIQFREQELVISTLKNTSPEEIFVWSTVVLQLCSLHLLRVDHDLRLDARNHVLGRTLGLPAQRPAAVAARTDVRAEVPPHHLVAEVLLQLVDGELGRLGVVGQPEFEHGLPDGLGDVEPLVLAVLAEIEAMPAVAGLVRLRDGVVEDGHVELGDYER